MKEFFECEICNKIFTKKEDCAVCEAKCKSKEERNKEVELAYKNWSDLKSKFNKDFNVLGENRREVKKASMYNGKYYINDKEVSKDDFDMFTINFW